MRIFFRNKFFSNHAIHFLNATQFLGALNDNIVKYLVVFFLIQFKGQEFTSKILFLVGIIYVIPFLLFSSAAGMLADRFSKQRLILILKCSEIFITFITFFAFSLRSEMSCYLLLFFLSIHSAAFGPPKYSIIPELVKPNAISKANGLIVSSTYLAIIFGTFLSSFIAQITNFNPFWCALLPFFIALIGFVTSVMIPYTKTKKTHTFINPFFPYEIYQTLKICKNTPHLLTIIFASAFFLFTGAFFQLNIIPFSMNSLHLNQIGGGYLFLSTSLGIATGSFIAGRLSKKRVEIGLSCIAAFFLALSFLLLPFSSVSIVLVFILLAFLGLAGGLFIVPLDTFVQTYSPEESRGRIIAAANFLSFFGVFIAPILLYVLNAFLQFSAATSFFLIGWVILGVFLCMLFRFAKEVFHFIGNFFLKSFIISSLPAEENILVLHPFSLKIYFLLFGLAPKTQFYLISNKPTFRESVLSFFSAYKIVYIEKNSVPSLHYLYKRIKEQKKEDEYSCLILQKSLFDSHQEAFSDPLLFIKREGKAIQFLPL